MISVAWGSFTFWWKSYGCNFSMFNMCTRSGSPHNVVHSSSITRWESGWFLPTPLMSAGCVMLYLAQIHCMTTSSADFLYSAFVGPIHFSYNWWVCSSAKIYLILAIQLLHVVVFFCYCLITSSVYKLSIPVTASSPAAFLSTHFTFCLISWLLSVSMSVLCHARQLVLKSKLLLLRITVIMFHNSVT